MKKTKILGGGVLGVIACLVIFRMVQSDWASEPLQSASNLISSKPALSQKRAFYFHPERTDYDVIAENNLFRPLGWKKEVPKPPKPVPKIVPESIVEIPPPPPTYTLVLTGIVQNGSEWIAVVEDRKRNEGVFLRPGEMLKDVFVQDILSEHITLARSESTVQLALGESIEYGTDGRTQFDTAGTANRPKVARETSRSSEVQTGDGDHEQSLIERMRARRRRELDQ